MQADNSLQPKPVPTPPPGLGNIPADQLPGPGRPPLRSGDVAMSDYTRTQLEKLGWTQGDPVPGDLGIRIQEVQAEIRAEGADARIEDSDLAVGWKKPKANFVNIDDLPPERQAELRQYLQEYKQETIAQKEEAAQRAAVDAEIPDSVQGPMRELTREQIIQSKAAEARRSQQQQPQSEVIDDRVVNSGPPAGMEIPEGKKYGGLFGASSVAGKIDEAKQKTEAANQQQKVSQTEPLAEPVASGIQQAAMSNCPRCLWPLSQSFDLKVTSEDKQVFLASILGTSRFQKKYDILGGNAVIYYRSLTTNEAAAIQYQLGCDIRNGNIHGDGEFLAWLMEYRLVASVSRIDIGKNTIARIKSIDDWVKDHPEPPAKPLPEKQSEAATEAMPTEALSAFDAGLQRPDTPLPRMREWFYKEIVTQEPLRRIIGQQHREFQRLVEALEAMTSDSSFWKGIELPVS